MVTIKSGGGINSNKTVQSRSGYKPEPHSTAIDPAGVSQRDVSTAFRKTPVVVGPGYSPGKMPATGGDHQVKGLCIHPGLRERRHRLVRCLLAEPLMSDLIRVIDLNEERMVMARYVLTKAFWTGQQRVRAGRIIAQTQAEAQPGDVVWSGTLPDGAVSVGSVPPGTAYLGVDSVD